MDFAASAFDIKSLNDSGSIEGLLAGFGNVDLAGDKLLPGCLTKTLAARTTPLPMLLHHDFKRPIGAWKDWQERPEGLYVKGSITLGTRDGQEAHALARDGALSGLSIGFVPTKFTRAPNAGRDVSEAHLLEGSLVTVPMNERAQVATVKSIAGVRDIEEMLNAGGFSNRQAKAAASAAWKAINSHDDEAAAEAEAAAILKASAARIAAIGGKR